MFIENPEIALEVIEKCVFRAGFVLFVIYEFAVFFRFLYRNWNKDNEGGKK